MFSRNDLDELVAMDARPAISIYLPTHVAGREIRQDPIRLKTCCLLRRNGSLPHGVKAARYARVDTLFLAGDHHLWGWFDESGDRVTALGRAADGDIDSSTLPPC